MRIKTSGKGLTYKDVCGEEPSVWFSLKDMKKEGKAFLQWARDLGCVWLNGEAIDPRGGTDFFHLAIHADSKLTNVGMFAFMARKRSSHPAPLYDFTEYIKSLNEGEQKNRN